MSTLYSKNVEPKDIRQRRLLKELQRLKVGDEIIYNQIRCKIIGPYFRHRRGHCIAVSDLEYGYHVISGDDIYEITLVNVSEDSFNPEVIDGLVFTQEI